MVITVQRTTGAYAQAVPAGAWHAAGTARTARGLARVYWRTYKATHPQPNAWSGHVRCVSENGTVLDYGSAFVLLGGDPERLPAKYW